MSLSIPFPFGWLLNKKVVRVEVNISLAFLYWVVIALHHWPFVSYVAIFVLKGDVKLQVTTIKRIICNNHWVSGFVHGWKQSCNCCTCATVGFRLAATVDEVFTGLCEATITEICALHFSYSCTENVHCTGHSICSTVSMEKRQVLLLHHYSSKFIEMLNFGSKFAGCTAVKKYKKAWFQSLFFSLTSCQGC